MRRVSKKGYKNSRKSIVRPGREVHFYKGCGDKNRFSSRKLALARRRVWMDKAESYEIYLDMERLQAYKCRAGGNSHWHLGKP